MQIVIPMAGFGERFRRAGYDLPKPLIPVEGRPMIAHVLDLFPGEHDVLFICNQDHLDEPSWRMRETLEELLPEGRIVGIAPHRRGPVHSVVQVLDRIDPDRPVVVNCCDFTTWWDWWHFRYTVNHFGADGAVVAYRGFHPHLLRSVHYAFLQEEAGWATAIQEKQAWTDDPMQELCSNGTYWFAKGALVREYFPRVLADDDLRIAGEHYVSQVYQPMIDDGLAVAAYEVQHFMQWGAPNDLDDYLYWSRGFTRRVVPPPRGPALPGTLLIPMAGLGTRFANEGYTLPKPLIGVCGAPMAVQAAKDLPTLARQVFVLRKDLPGLAEVSAALDAAFPGCERRVLDQATDGQARTCLLGLAGADPEAPVVVGTCDNGVLYDGEAHARLLDDGADVLVWVVRRYPNANLAPRMYGWVDAGPDGRIRRIAVKEPLDDPHTDPIVIGAFTFRRAADMQRAIERLIARDGRVNGELYLDTAIVDAMALGLDCRVFEVEHYDGWGTPNELRTFEYWQSCFHKWSHPYRLQDDARVAQEAIAGLEEHFADRPSPVPSAFHPRAGRGMTGRPEPEEGT